MSTAPVTLDARQSDEPDSIGVQWVVSLLSPIPGDEFGITHRRADGYAIFSRLKATSGLSGAEAAGRVLREHLEHEPNAFDIDCFGDFEAADGVVTIFLPDSLAGRYDVTLHRPAPKPEAGQ